MKTRLACFSLSLGLLLGLGLALGAAAPARTATPDACVPGPHSGTIAASQEWCPQDNPHLLSGDVVVGSGAVLTILPDVVVRGQPQVGDDGTDIRVQGTLRAYGTSAQPILFTSVADTGAGQWGGLVFDGGSGSLTYATIRYAGLGNHANVLVRNVGAVVQIQNSAVLTQSAAATDYGLYVENSRVRVQNSRLAGSGNSTGDYGVYAVGPGAALTLTQVTVERNAGSGIGLAGGASVAVNRSTLRANGRHGIEAAGTNTRLALRGGTIVQQVADAVNVPSGLSAFSVVGTRLVSNGGDAINYNGSATGLLRYGYVYGNGGFGLRNQNSAVCFDAQYVYWGDLAGPNDTSAVNDGCLGPVSNASPAGEEMTDDVDYYPWVGVAPTATLVGGSSPGVELVHIDLQGLRTTVDVPAGVAAGTFILVYTRLPQPDQPLPPGRGFANHGFDLSSYGSGTALPGFTFLKPVTVTVEYSNADLAGMDEATLKLLYWAGNAWLDAASTCTPAAQYIRAPALNRLSVPICHLTQFALVGQKQVRLYYMPFVTRQR